EKEPSDVEDSKKNTTKTQTTTNTTNVTTTTSTKGNAIEITAITQVVREGPSTSYKKVGTVHEGEIYLVEDIASNGWYQIRTKEGVLGWMSNSSSRSKVINYNVAD